MSMDTAAHLLVEAARREDYQPTAASERAFQDLTITARVQASLVVSAKTRNLILNVRAEGGEVYVSGILAQPDLETEIVRIVESVPGVKKVTPTFESPPIEYMYP